MRVPLAILSARTLDQYDLQQGVGRQAPQQSQQVPMAPQLEREQCTRQHQHRCESVSWRRPGVAAIIIIVFLSQHETVSMHGARGAAIGKETHSIDTIAPHAWFKTRVYMPLREFVRMYVNVCVRVCSNSLLYLLFTIA